MGSGAEPPAEVEFDAFCLTSGGNNFDDFPENQITEFHGEFRNFIHAEFGNVNHKLCNCVCVLLQFDRKDDID